MEDVQECRYFWIVTFSESMSIACLRTFTLPRICKMIIDTSVTRNRNEDKSNLKLKSVKGGTTNLKDYSLARRKDMRSTA